MAKRAVQSYALTPRVAVSDRPAGLVTFLPATRGGLLGGPAVFSVHPEAPDDGEWLAMAEAVIAEVRAGRWQLELRYDQPLAGYDPCDWRFVQGVAAAVNQRAQWRWLYEMSAAKPRETERRAWRDDVVY